MWAEFTGASGNLIWAQGFTCASTWKAWNPFPKSTCRQRSSFWHQPRLGDSHNTRWFYWGEITLITTVDYNSVGTSPKKICGETHISDLVQKEIWNPPFTSRGDSLQAARKDAAPTKSREFPATLQEWRRSCYSKPKRGFACTNSDIDPSMIIQLFILQTN